MRREMCQCGRWAYVSEEHAGPAYCFQCEGVIVPSVSLPQAVPPRAVERPRQGHGITERERGLKPDVDRRECRLPRSVEERLAVRSPDGMVRTVAAENIAFSAGSTRLAPCGLSRQAVTASVQIPCWRRVTRSTSVSVAAVFPRWRYTRSRLST